MSDRFPFEDAAARLLAALDTFETAVQRRRGSEEAVREIEDDLHLLAMDRARLARELDDMTARARDLAAANETAATRLDAAIAAVGDILADAEG